MGDRIRHYEQIRILYRLGFNKIALMKCTDDGQQYVLKHIQIAKRDEAQLNKEGQINLKIKHPNIVPIKETFNYEIGAERYYVIVMEYCRQGNLDNLIGDEERKDAILPIMQQIASAVKYLHGINVAHRDMKPENVLLKNMHAKVSDLGLAKILKTKKSKSNSGVFGTQFYIAPQVLQQGKYDLGVDIWALGIIFLQLLSGQRLFHLIQGSVEPALREDFPNQQTFKHVQSEKMKQLIAKMLIKDRSKRIKIDEVIHTLDSIEEQSINQEKFVLPLICDDIYKSALEDIAELQSEIMLPEYSLFRTKYYSVILHFNRVGKVLTLLATCIKDQSIQFFICYQTKDIPKEISQYWATVQELYWQLLSSKDANRLQVQFSGLVFRVQKQRLKQIRLKLQAKKTKRFTKKNASETNKIPIKIQKHQLSNESVKNDSLSNAASAENNYKSQSNIINDKIFGTVQSEFRKGNGIILAKNLVLTCAKLIYNRQKSQTAVSVNFSLDSICSSSFAYEPYEQYKMQPNDCETVIQCKYDYALLLLQKSHEPPLQGYPYLILDYDHQVAAKLPNVAFFVGNRQLKFNELRIESKLIYIECVLQGNSVGLPIYFKLSNKGCFVFGMCCGVKNSQNRQIAVFINENVINNIIGIEGQWNYIQTKSIKTEKLAKIANLKPQTLQSLNSVSDDPFSLSSNPFALSSDPQYQKLKKQFQLKKDILGDSIDTALSAEQLGHYCSQIGSYKESTTLYTEACENYRKYAGQKSQMYANCLHNLANSYVRQEQILKALQIYLKAHEINMLNSPIGNERSIKTIFVIANIYAQMSNYLLAIQYYEQAIPIMRRLGLGDKLSDIYYLLPTLYIQLNKPAGEVMKIIKEAIEINSILYGDNNKKSAYMLTVMADYSADTCNHSESLSWIQKALNMSKIAKCEGQILNGIQNTCKSTLIKLLSKNLIEKDIQLAQKIVIEYMNDEKLLKTIKQLRKK